MGTNVPSASLTAVGFQAPLESAVLAGVLGDYQAAFGGVLNPSLSTPQGQLAQSTAAIIGDANDQFLALANGVDPAFASGRLQDAIGRIYFMERNPAQSTVVSALCTGLPGTSIPVNSQAQDTSGNLYLCTGGGVIASGGAVTLSFACATTGPIPCPSGALSKIYQAIPGWDSVTNASAGVLGNDAETRADFEFRRQQSVALNAVGILSSVLASVLALPGVLDAYALENPLSTDSGAIFVASIAGTTMTVTAITSGTLMVGQVVTGGGVAQGTSITALGTGTGGVGTYSLGVNQTVSSTTLNAGIGGIVLTKNSIYVSVYGGNSQAIANAIWLKKAPGCNYNGNTTVTVTDTVSGYNAPLPTYQVSFETPTPTPILFSVVMQNNSGVPSNAIPLVQNAIIAAFNGVDGGQRARIGSNIFASRYYAGIASLGSWSLIISVQLGVGTANQNGVLMRADQVPTLTASNIAVTFV